ncbi:MAG: hypothetical protein KAI02_06020 [Gammaproteobacteria bacterium]|nr:hypothetical protein [Gammaproteobacteria bacterium]
MSSTSYASFHNDADSIFNWAETHYPELLKSKQNSQNIDNWYYRHYPQLDSKDDVYVGVNPMGDVYTFIANKLQREGSIEDFLERVHHSDVDIEIVNHAGNGQCVNVPLPTSGLDVNYSISTMDENREFNIVYNHTNDTFAQSTITIDFNESMSLSDISSLANMVDLGDMKNLADIKNLTNMADLGDMNNLVDISNIMTQQNYQIIDNYLYLKSTEVNSTLSLPYLGSTAIIVTSTNSEPQKIGPILNYCEQQSWSTQIVNQSITSNAIYSIPETTEIIKSKLKGGSVDAINEEINISAGYFNTVRITEYFDHGYVITWLSIDEGIFVKAEAFNNSDELISQIEATLIK